MTARNATRASGRTAAEEAAKDASDTFEELAEPQEPGERDVQFDHPGLHRLRTDWTAEDLRILDQVRKKIDKVLWQEFWDLFLTLDKLHSIVREAAIVPGTNRQKKDDDGNPEWMRDEQGMPVEDWSRLTDYHRHDLLFRFTNGLFNWEQNEEKLRADALFAKAKWEELFAVGFESLEPVSATKPTERDRESRAKRVAADERYFAVFANGLSRRATALLRSATRMHNTLERSLPRR